MDMTAKLENFRDWMPARLYWHEQRIFADWWYMGKRRFTRPFFDNTIESLPRKPFNLLFRHQLPVEFLGELYEQKRGLAPSGFIFHMSRCGSTLAAQMLASTVRNIVISEPPTIDWILRLNRMNPAITDEQRATLLKWIVSAYGRKRQAKERFYFIKFDSWNTLDVDFIRRVFPEVPWIFLYRNPIEVMVSQLRERGSQMIPGSIEQILPGLDFIEAIQMPPEEYIARVLAQFCESAIEGAKNNNALLVNYNQLPEAIDAIIEHFRVEYSTKDIEQIKRVAQFNAKSPGFSFTSDSEEKRKQASEAARQMTEKWLSPLYARLEKMRSEN
jgi:hypothetical protein